MTISSLVVTNKTILCVFFDVLSPPGSNLGFAWFLQQTWPFAAPDPQETSNFIYMFVGFDHFMYRRV